MNFYRRLLANHPLANIAFAVVLVMGTLAYLTMPREQDPEINFNWVVITTVLPGASAEDVEKRVTKPLEDAIKGVADIRFSMSSSRENVSNILVRFREISERVFDKRVNDLRRDIQNKASSELPAEANDPRVMEVTTSNGFPTALVVVKGAANDENLRRRARLLRDDFERMAGIDQVFATGLADPELRVEFDPAALANRGLSGADVADAAFAWFRDTFAGKAETLTHEGRDAWLVRVVGQHADPERLAQIPVGKGRDQTTLGSVADVQRARAKPGSLASHDGQPAVMLAITKKSRTNTLELMERINAFIAAQNDVMASEGVQLQLLDDQTHRTRESIRIMESNALVGLAVVLAISWLFLGPRIAVLVGLGLPFSLAGTFAILGALGYTVNISVLLGVVIALGMLVDDAVVVVEAIYYKMQRGLAAMEASVAAMREVFAPVTSSVLTTMAAFLPLLLLPGIVGKFMFVIPFIVTLALAISLFEAYWMLPVHVVSLGGKPPPTDDWRARFNHLLRVKYSRWLITVMRWPRLSLAAAALMFVLAGAAVATGMVRVQFFAFDPMRIFYVNIDMPAGAPIEESLAQAAKLEAKVRAQLTSDEVRNSAAYAGIKFTDTEPLYGGAYGQVVVSLKPQADGGRSVQEIVAAVRPAIEALPSLGKVSFTMISGGPPTTKPVRVRVRGDDPLELRAAADALLAVTQAVPGARDVTDDDIPGRPQLVLELDREALRGAGLDAARVARLVRLAVDGEIIAQTRDLGEKLELRVRAKRDAGSVGHDILNLLNDPVALANGQTTTLGALVKAETKVGAGVIKHYNLVRAITVEADLDKTITDTTRADTLIQDGWRKIAAQFPHTSIDFSGEMEDIRESLDAMKVLFLFGVGLIYLILAAQFKSYFQPLLILVTVPLAFTGVALGLLISQNPLSLYTLYGVIALTGIAVNSAIVLIDAANERRKAGMSVLHAAVYAARRRVVPILITSVTTIGGLFSLAFGLAGDSLLWGPVAQSIVWGLTFSTVLTLFVIPLLYWLAMRRQKVAL
ncbi:MAG: efflux RND transporter permease subunit [Rhodocyclaceae bacterium]|nr:efflux RND transporter permease subunit [Rhodocyclaceae bacterium]MDZ4215959.1 efflux RND transporter permease subunit [Rhodocyclaceae bacterium]